MSNTSESNIAGLRVEQLRCEFLTDPLGIDAAFPRLSWELTSQRDGAQPVAHRVVADEWDSGWIESGETTAEYGGAPLASAQRIAWRVDVRDDKGNITTSPPAWFETGLLSADDWSAR